jgi:hypothetical protein
VRLLVYQPHNLPSGSVSHVGRPYKGGSTCPCLRIVCAHMCRAHENAADPAGHV